MRINEKNCVKFENEIFLRGIVMPNTTRWYEIAGNFSPHFTRICFLDNFHLFATLTRSSKQILRQFRTLSLYY
jgi:hypothetical protein